jgi:hypothetical protein
MDDPGITDIAACFAAHLPTGAKPLEVQRQEWRTTLYNARATNTLRPLTEMVIRAAPHDAQVHALCRGLLRSR